MLEYNTNSVFCKHFASMLSESSEIIRGEEVEIKIKIKESQVESIRRKLFALGSIKKLALYEKDIITEPYRDLVSKKQENGIMN